MGPYTFGVSFRLPGASRTFILPLSGGRTGFPQPQRPQYQGAQSKSQSSETLGLVGDFDLRLLGQGLKFEAN